MNNELYHHGIKGQRWGIRRYQNEDGTRTTAGKKRYSTDGVSDDDLAKDVKRWNLEKNHAKLYKERNPDKLESVKSVLDSGYELTNRAKGMVRSIEDSANQPVKKPRMNLSKMTDQELRTRINRECMERQYNDLFNKPETVQKGKFQVSDTIELIGGLAAIGGSALSIALAVKQLKGK